MYLIKSSLDGDAMGLSTGTVKILRPRRLAFRGPYDQTCVQQSEVKGISV